MVMNKVLFVELPADILGMTILFRVIWLSENNDVPHSYFMIAITNSIHSIMLIPQFLLESTVYLTTISYLCSIDVVCPRLHAVFEFRKFSWNGDGTKGIMLFTIVNGDIGCK